MFYRGYTVDMSKVPTPASLMVSGTAHLVNSNRDRSPVEFVRYVKASHLDGKRTVWQKSKRASSQRGCYVHAYFPSF